MQIRLDALNKSGVSGAATLTARSNGDLGIKITASGMVPNSAHAQHIHGSAAGKDFMCPSQSADADGDGFVNTEEGLPAYGDIFISLTTTGDTARRRGCEQQIDCGGQDQGTDLGGTGAGAPYQVRSHQPTGDPTDRASGQDEAEACRRHMHSSSTSSTSSYSQASRVSVAPVRSPYGAAARAAASAARTRSPGTLRAAATVRRG